MIGEVLPATILVYDEMLRKFTLSELNYATGRERKEEGKPCVTSVKIILFETTFRQTSLSFKWICFVKTVNVKVR